MLISLLSKYNYHSKTAIWYTRHEHHLLQKEWGGPSFLPCGPFSFLSIFTRCHNLIKYHIIFPTFHPLLPTYLLGSCKFSSRLNGTCNRSDQNWLPDILYAHPFHRFPPVVRPASSTRPVVQRQPKVHTEGARAPPLSQIFTLIKVVAGGVQLLITSPIERPIARQPVLPLHYDNVKWKGSAGVPPWYASL